MCLFEKSAIYRPKLIGWRDTAARFLHDLATSGTPMSLTSLKASCDAVAEEEEVRQTDKAAPGVSQVRSFRLIGPCQTAGALAAPCR